MKIEEEVLDTPITMPYDIAVRCANDPDIDYKTVSLKFYPLTIRSGTILREFYPLGIPGQVREKFYLLELSQHPRGPKQREAVEYLVALVNSELAGAMSDDEFSWRATNWTANQCVLDDAPQVIQDFMATLPVRILANV